MVLSAFPSDASLGEFLAARARSSSGRRLAFDAAVGAMLACLSAWQEASLPLLAVSSGTCFFAYGAWGLVDRIRTHRAATSRRLVSGALEAFSALLVAIGIIAAFAILFTVWAAALGTWIS